MRQSREISPFEGNLGMRNGHMRNLGMRKPGLRANKPRSRLAATAACPKRLNAVAGAAAQRRHASGNARMRL
jgi:hypothetical protein